MQAQAVRQQTASVTSAQSLTLMRNLFRTAVSMVCYLRGVFPEVSVLTHVTLCCICIYPMLVAVQCV
ncbi:hypothetical protein KIPB_006619 [Kipferlia bialata]|uniref:Uncharacterized protein n=1 Tax=Kipferlia bialata TaxID=797122 RepID=A0A391NPU7_9EUKA|nr:hypothetical protein KIPB_006619 [Kipferlia bialata]|eukprot:g6619.t1